MRAAAAKWPARRRGSPARVSGETRVVSTANWAPPPECQPVGDDFDAPIIEVLDVWDVEVCQSGVGGDPCTGFPAHSGCCAFKWASTATKNSRLGTGCAVVA